MVSVGKLKAGRERYYLDQVQHPGRAQAIASGAEDYYVGGHESEGEWTGRAAATLGVEGVVSGQALHRLLAGEHPLDGSQLKRSGSVAAFDVPSRRPRASACCSASATRRCNPRSATRTAERSP